jgi:mono/diheme cytochrome c family protein
MKFAMSSTSIGMVFVAAAFSLPACGQDTPPPKTDTAVHSAEAAQGRVPEIMAAGEKVYLGNCAACHQPTGVGLPGAFPPLAGSDYLERDRKDVLSAALFGLSGPVTVNGVQYNGVMPSMGYLSDEDLAAALTYVLNSWGNSGAAVSVAEVAALREELGQQDRAAGERHTGTTEAEMRRRWWDRRAATSPAGASVSSTATRFWVRFAAAAAARSCTWPSPPPKSDAN